MTVINRQSQAIQSTISLNEFAAAMRQLDTTFIPDESKTAAIMDHLAKIMIASSTSMQARQDLTSALLQRQSLRWKRHR
jgi:hypothetical protein